ncbi:hypothetical protein CF327_g3993 [Tilletia walkeri]|nr:hypothetical protein CF327_g3993 [Tilletia walkeri]
MKISPLSPQEIVGAVLARVLPVLNDMQGASTKFDTSGELLSRPARIERQEEVTFSMHIRRVLTNHDFPFHHRSSLTNNQANLAYETTKHPLEDASLPGAKRQATSTTAEDPETNSGLTMGSTHAHLVTVINSYDHSTTTTAEIVQAGTQALLAELEEAKTGIAAEKVKVAERDKNIRQQSETIKKANDDLVGTYADIKKLQVVANKTNEYLASHNEARKKVEEVETDLKTAVKRLADIHALSKNPEYNMRG